MMEYAARVYFSKDWKRCVIQKDGDNVVMTFYFKDGKRTEFTLSKEEWWRFLDILGLSEIIEVV